MNTTRISTAALMLALVLGFAGPSALKGQTAANASASVVLPLIKFNGTMVNPGTQNQALANGSARLVTATFSLYEFQEGGTPLWSETQKVQVDAQGRYVVLLGSTAQAGMPMDLFTTGKALWLGVQPQLSGVGELPRVLLAPVPYALKASDADTLGGKPASAYALAGAPTVVGLPGGMALPAASPNTAPPGSPEGKTVNKDASPQPLTTCAAVTSDGTATIGTVAKFTAPCIVENSLLRDSGTGVAVGGTAPPGALLDVQFTSTATSSTVFGQRVLTTFNPAAASSAQASGFFSDALTQAGNAQNITGSLYAAALLTNHYGTGTLTSAYGLSNGVLNRGSGTMTNAFGIFSGISNFSTGKITNGYGVYVASPASAPGGTFSNYSGVYIASPTAVAGAYGLYSQGGRNYFGGNVGIGTTTPAASLEVNGAAKFDGLMTFAPGQTFPILTGGVTNTMLAHPSLSVLAGADLLGGGVVPLGGATTLNLDISKVPQLATANTFYGNQTVYGDVAASGDTRVDFSGFNTGSYTPGIRFGTGNTGEGIGSDRVGTVNVNGIDLYTSFLPRMSITNKGLVGIGTATPAALLDVEGGTAASGVGRGLKVIGQTGATLSTGTATAPNGGPLVLTGGNGGLQNGTGGGGNGGGITLTAGNGGVPEGAGGNVSITAGNIGTLNSGDFGFGGNITLQPGKGSGPGAFPGNIYMAVNGGKVGIGTINPDAALSVNGTADKPAGGSWGTYSDRRLKTVDGPFHSGLSQVLNLNPIRYRYNEDNPMGIRSPGEHIGVVAQEVQKVIPEAVSENSKGYLIVNNDPIIWSMLNAIKQQQTLIVDQKAQAAKQQARSQAQQAEIAKLKFEVAEQRKQAEMQQAAMKQLLVQVHSIQATLAVGQSALPSRQVAGAVHPKAAKPEVAHPSGQAAPALVAKVRY